jgi:NCAIR mutase (PurE)-related protein
MTPESLHKLLAKVVAGEVSADEAAEQLRAMPVTDLAHSTLDTHRELRQGVPEVVYGDGKSPEEIAACLRHLHEAHGRALATRVNPRKARLVRDALPEAEYHASCRCLTAGFDISAPAPDPEVFVVTAGTSDSRVALEAVLTLRFLGHGVGQINDAGVAGLHRLLAHLPALRRARVLIAVAGMEGALASVLAGLVACPVVGVPTSIGYGVAEGGKTALHAMLSSCASGLAVVNIDNGFGAAILAHKILTAQP